MKSISDWINSGIEAAAGRDGVIPTLIQNLAAAAIAIGLIMILGFCTFALIFTEVPKANQNALLIVIGILSTQVTSIVNFFFGSSITTNKKHVEPPKSTPPTV